MRRIALRLINQQGDANLIALAVTLPIILLMIAAAVDVARVPLARQSLLNAIHIGFRKATLDYLQGTPDSGIDVATGQDWCMFPQADYAGGGMAEIKSCNPCGNACPRPTVSGAGCDCSGGEDIDSSDVYKAVAVAVEDEIISSIGSGLPTNNADYIIEARIYNLIVNKAGRVKNYSLAGPDLLTIGNLGWNFDFGSAMNQFVAGDPELGPWMGDPVNGTATHIPVIVIGAAVRINPFFELTNNLDLGATPAPALPDGVYLEELQLQPLKRTIRLSGKLL